ncbi:MAG: hypothetical protein RLZZ52_1152 [Actinomycetota bacterium]|jgi:hypothetical protein
MTNALEAGAAPTTIKLSKATRDRIKSNAAKQNLTIEEHLNFLEDLHARELRWDAMRQALAQMTPQDWIEYHAESANISGSDLDGLSDENW